MTAIYSSPLLRATQTAQIISACLGVDVQITHALREFDTGDLEGRSDPEGWAQYDQVMADWLLLNKWESRLPGGESFDDIRSRFEPFILSLVETSTPEANILLVGHGGIYRCMLPVLLNNLDFEFTRTHHIGNTEYVLAEMCEAGLVCISWCGLEC
jgi:probable phosphoglycerate mutase